MLPFVNKETQELTNPDAIPKCPKCSGPMMMNVRYEFLPAVLYALCMHACAAMSSCNQRGGDWFVEDHFKEQAVRMSMFLKDAAKPGNKLVLLEIGAGFNTPTVIRHRFEIIAYQRLHNGSPCKFIRLNLQV